MTNCINHYWMMRVLGKKIIIMLWNDDWQIKGRFGLGACTCILEYVCSYQTNTVNVDPKLDPNQTIEI